MNLTYSNLLPIDFSAESRVWIYQSSRLFTMSESLQIEEILNEFASNWKSHNIPVKGFGTLFFGQFIILMADETATDVSGCSTDSSVRLIKEIEKSFAVNLFDRTNLAFVINDKIQILPMSQLKYAMENEFIGPNTLFVDNNVHNKLDLINRWIIPIKDSWLGKKFQVSTNI